MGYLYLKALHIIFIVTWFAGIFYFPRLLIYNAEAQDNPNEEVKNALTRQFNTMAKRLWYGITIPSAVFTLIFGLWVMIDGGWVKMLFGNGAVWLDIKLFLVLLLYIYNYTLHVILKQQLKGNFKYTSQQLRVWNEVATIILVATVFLVVVKNALSLVYGTLGLILFIILLMSAINIYKIIRKKETNSRK